MTASTSREDLDGAVLEHTAHSAIVAARSISAAVVATYNPAQQAAAERRLTYSHNTADERRNAGRTS
ncbi:hypothetical protein [Lentzea cavernae]|uniref:Uncharacterized protein n=1 Tax=Lentzea cavernae TaxID=2020703 RepID=A0ABQ3MQY5_9PSEU|nr:hypothetical protein [Lentzea cavernae]GHH57519.1 hypothetical protein GCM10017774_77150 [Lentzea cavernae]